VPGLRVEGLHVRRGGHAVLRGVDLEVGAGDVVVVLGGSGSGKTTLLRTVAGLERPDRGSVLIDGEDVTRRPPGARDIGMVLQDAPMDPLRDVRRNLGFPLSVRRVERDEIDRRVTAEARAFSLEDLLGALPGRLSEGQRHAAATARSLVRVPRLLLLDEPLADLDRPARTRATRQIAEVQAGYRVPLLVATNDQSVAATLAGRIAVLVSGRIAQVGSYIELHGAPATTAVATLVGEPPMALLAGRVAARGERHVLEGPGIVRPSWDRRLASLAGGPVTLGLRPEALQVAERGAGAHARGRVIDVAFLGPDGLVRVALDEATVVTARLPRPLPRAGDVLALRLDPVHVFDRDGRHVATVR
jgi:ABC-type sugar transport system ATPase subunit